MIKGFCLLFLFLLFISCKETEKERITRLVTEWQGKEIIFPENPVFTRYVNDTVDYQIPESDFKVVVYVDSIGCTSCKLLLYRWKDLIAQVDSLTDQAVPFLFFFHPKDGKELREFLRRDHFDLPVVVDHQDAFNRKNNFPSETTFQTFLLDRDNKVVVLGNPVLNLSVKALYLEQITGNKPTKQLQTLASINKKEADLGAFPMKEERKAVFEIKNEGEHPLVILDVTTTCGCTTASYPKQPIAQGKTAQIEVGIKPREVGQFFETATVKTNTKETIKLHIRGQAK